MILSDDDIRSALRDGLIEIDPPPEADQYTTSAVDLTLGDEFLIWDKEKLTVPGLTLELNLAEQQYQLTARQYLKKLPCESDGSVVLPPYGKSPWHILGLTNELVHLKADSRLAARVEGRSSHARLGLVVHLTAPTIHAHFRGRITLEIINFGPFTLRLVPRKTRICQLIFERLESAPGGEIATRFQGQTSSKGRTKP